jgi:ABC-type nitrate/sulfonate/bicarbonate transport system substrate-binding protein
LHEKISGDRITSFPRLSNAAHRFYGAVRTAALGKTSQNLVMKEPIMVFVPQRPLCLAMIIAYLFIGTKTGADPLLAAYGGHNETMIPLWIGIEKGIFRRYGVDLRVLQTRSGPIMMATLASGGVPLVWAAPSSALNSSVSGFRLTCFAAGNNRIPRELVARKGIESLDDLRGKSFGVQSIGGGFWLSTMGALEALKIDPDKYKLNMRVLGDTGTVTQALITGNVDAMVVPYSYADMAKRSGARSLADIGTVNMVFQLTVMCAPKDSPAISQEIMINLTKGLIESLAYILEPANKRDVAEALKKNLRLSREEDVEAAYKVARLQMPNLDVAPSLEAWGLFKRLLARVNPKVQEADLEQIITSAPVQHLESTGFLPAMRKKLTR